MKLTPLHFANIGIGTSVTLIIMGLLDAYLSITPQPKILVFVSLVTLLFFLAVRFIVKKNNITEF